MLNRGSMVWGFCVYFVYMIPLETDVLRKHRFQKSFTCYWHYQNPLMIFKTTMERIFYEFLWNGGPDRIKRIIIVKNLKAGGLRMVNISEFSNALNVLAS